MSNSKLHKLKYGIKDGTEVKSEAFANNSSANSRGFLGGSLRSLLNTALPLIGNVLNQ